MRFQPTSRCDILYRTDKGAILQDDGTRQFILEFQGRSTRFKVAEFLQFKKNIDDLDLKDLFLSEGKGIDIQIIHQKGSGHLFVFTLCELVNIKELLQGAMAMIELNRIINDRLQAVVRN